MPVRPATSEDASSIRELAQRSLEASYTLSPGTIKGAVRQWYADDAWSEKLDAPDGIVLVAERDGTVVGFTEGVVDATGDQRKSISKGDGDLLWLHVDPDYRGEGIGNELFHAIRETLMEHGATRIRGRVLRDNADGNEFYRQHGLVRATDERIDIDGTEYVENIYVEEESSPIESVVAGNGELYLDPDDTERGSVAPFLVAYEDKERTERYGFYCSNCTSIDIAMDAMGRAECNDCGNLRKPTRWDAAHL